MLDEKLSKRVYIERPFLIYNFFIDYNFNKLLIYAESRTKKDYLNIRHKSIFHYKASTILYRVDYMLGPIKFKRSPSMWRKDITSLYM